MTDEKLPQNHIRVQTLAGTHDLLTDAPLMVFTKLVAGDGFLYLTNPERTIPYHAVVELQLVSQPPAVATMTSAGNA